MTDILTQTLTQTTYTHKCNFPILHSLEWPVSSDHFFPSLITIPQHSEKQYTTGFIHAIRADLCDSLPQHNRAIALGLPHTLCTLPYTLTFTFIYLLPSIKARLTVNTVHAMQLFLLESKPIYCFLFFKYGGAFLLSLPPRANSEQRKLSKNCLPLCGHLFCVARPADVDATE